MFKRLFRADLQLHEQTGGMVDESIAFMKRCTHASVRRMGLQILCPLSRDGEVASKSGGDLIERSGSVAADNLRCYVRDSDPKQYWQEGCQPL
jgi:hypothetical protein